MIEEIKNLDINSVVLETHEDKSTAHLAISFDTDEPLEDIERYHIRAFVGLTPDAGASLDYIVQRYNEFLQGDAGLVGSSDYNDFLKQALGSKHDYLSVSSPFSPFSMDTIARDLIIKKNISKYGEGNIVSDGVVIYDQDLKTATMIQGKDKSFIRPIEIDLPSGESLEHMSCYVFIYDNKMLSLFQDAPVQRFSLGIGMSVVENRTPLGIQTLYSKINKNKPFVGMKVSSTKQNPDKERLQVVTSPPSSSVQNQKLSIFNIVGEVFKSSESKKDYEIGKVIKKQNYFTDLWLTKDNEENIRFVFSFDSDSYLRDHGMFPGAYNADLEAARERSDVLSMEVYRNSLRGDGFVSKNNLGTIERGDDVRRLNIDQRNSKKPTNPLKEVKILLPNGSLAESTNSVFFYEGCDQFSDEDLKNDQQSGMYGYSVVCRVRDDSPKIMRKLIHTFIGLKRRLDHVYSSLISDSSVLFNNNPVYNLVTGELNVGLQNIRITADGSNINAEQEILNIVKTYQVLLQAFSTSAANLDLVKFYENKFKRKKGIIKPSIIKEIEALVDFGVKFAYDSLLKLFPTDPLGRGENSNKTGFSKNTSRSDKTNILTLRHTFSEAIERGKTDGLGVDYIFSDSTKGEFKSITNSQYLTRRVEEFRKYFFALGNNQALIPVGSYNDASYAYMTPKIIKTPSRDNINQVEFTSVGGTSIDYDYDRYGQLYVDLASLHDMTEKLGMLYPSLSSLAAKQNVNNKIFSSIRDLLGEKYSVSLSEEIIPQFSSPKVVQDNPKTTTYRLREKENCGPNGGALLIQSIIGGESTQSSEDKNYFTETRNSLKDGDPGEIKGQIDRRAIINDQKDRSIRLPFAILGELTLETKISQSEKGYKSSFNSLSELRKILNISEQNIENSTEGNIMSVLPNQLKNMLIVTSTKAPLALGEANGNSTFDARRFSLNEKNTEEGSDLVSFYSEQSKNATYFQTEDPMKSYATFMAFWMNYRQLAVVEYLDNFSNISRENINIDASAARFKLSSWLPLNAEIAQGLEERGGSILCRIRTMSADDYISLLGDNISQGQKDELAIFFEEKELLRVPSYNRYFYISEKGVREATTINPESEMLASSEQLVDLIG